MKSYLKSRLLRHVVASIILMSSVTAYSSIAAQVKSTEKVAYGDNYDSLSNQGRSRTYYLYTPKSYNPQRPTPLVIVFHGDDGSGRSMSDVSRFNELAEQKGFIVVYPDGVDHTWNTRGNSQASVNDVSFVSALIDRIQETRNIDSRKVYATGFSRGGILAQTLACQMPDKIAAFASVAGSLPVQLQSSCQSGTPVSMLMINGTKDQEVHYQGDDKSQPDALVSIPQTVNFWRSHDQCTAPAENSQLPNSNSGDLSVKTSRYSGCSRGAEVVEAAVVDGGHFWPGGASDDKNLKQVNAQLGFNATQTIWDFFQRHTLS